MARSPLSQKVLTPRLPALLILAAAGLSAQSMLPSSLPNGTIGEPLNGSGFVMQVSPETCTTRNWSVSAGALPPGVTLSQPQPGNLSAILSGKPSQTGTFSFTLTAAAGLPCGSPPPVPPVIKSYTLTIDSLALLPDSLGDGAVGSLYEGTTLIPGPAQTCFTYSVTSGILPPGLTLSSQSYYGFVSGTPTQEGVFTFTITGNEGNCAQAFTPKRSFARSYTMHILGISTSSLPQGTAGRPYPSTQLAVAGNLGSVQFGGTNLAPTLQVSQPGVISGTTTTAGTFNAAFNVSDLYSSFGASRVIPIVVNPFPTFPTSTLPGGTVGSPYSAGVAASGGTNPFTYAFESGNLPPGVNIGTGGAFTGTPTTAGTFNFMLRATDANGAVVTQSFAIVVAPAPVLTLNPPTLPTGYLGSAYSASLSVSGFTASFIYNVSAGSLPPGITLGTNGVFQGTPTQAGLFSFTARAIVAGASQAASRDYQIQVVSPVSFVTGATLPGAQVGFPYHVDFQATGGVPAYSFTTQTFSVPGLRFNSGANGNIDGTPTTAGTYSFDVLLNDSANGFATRTFSLTVAPAASITTTALPGGFLSKAYQATLATSGFGSAPTWSIVQGALPAGLVLNPATGDITGTPTQEGSYPFQVSATAGNQIAGPKALSIIIGVPGLDFTPDILPGGTIGVPYSQIFSPSGGTGGYVFSLTSGTIPPGLGLSVDGAVSGTPTTSGTFKFVVRLTSSNLVIERLVSLYVDPTVLDLSPSTLPDAYLGQDYSQGLTPSGGTAPFTFQVISGALPPSVSLDTATGTIAGKPTSVGLYTFGILLTDANHKQILRSYSLTVLNTVTLPGTVLPDGTQNETYPGAQITTSGGVAPFTFGVAKGALPNGLNLATDGSIAGTPLTSGDFSFDVQVTDGNGVSSVGTYSIRVFAVLTVSPNTLPDGLVLQDYTAQLSVAGGAPSYLFQVVSGSLPDGILFNAGSFYGAPTKAGSFEFDIKVTDSRQRTTTKHFSITVGGGPTINIQGVPPAAVVGVPYQAEFSTKGGRQPFRWSYTGNLPPGLSMDAATGAITGIPGAPGIYTFTVRIDDADNLSSTGGFSITVTLAPIGPVIFTPIPTSASPGSQINVGLTLTNPYPVALNGVLALQFTPDSGFDDPAVVFASGGRTLPFTIPAGSTGANFQVPNSAFQTGTVAGLITITASLNVQGADVTPTPVPTQQVRVPPSAPVITRVDLNKTTTGFELIVYGFSTPRQVTAANVKLTAAAGKSLTATDFPFTVGQIFTTYFTDSASAPFGSQFRLVLPFTVSDLTAIGSAAVTLTNSIGTSAPGSVTF
ncbi:Ig domain-containing protein [Paludibaculum fermentans]|uniref:Putative Ig domain-containing protein n=1 Tax=Paludibaculum fermentans TaxID=1473598 RepID=A0A7S7NKG3_PALFE|nr:Ig domain-containing protein [Paludibaculum fermentans]QOY85277.1 putative Ig domain-containing protein [Paludibaculum fermentans]